MKTQKVLLKAEDPKLKVTGSNPLLRLFLVLSNQELGTHSSEVWAGATFLCPEHPAVSNNNPSRPLLQWSHLHLRP